MTRIRAIELVGCVAIAGAAFVAGRRSAPSLDAIQAHGGSRVSAVSLRESRSMGTHLVSPPKLGPGNQFPNSREGREMSLESILSDSDGLSRSVALNDFFLNLQPEQLREVIVYLQPRALDSSGGGDQTLKANALHLGYAAWARSDPPTALKSASVWPAQSDVACLEAVAAAWAESDSEEAISCGREALGPGNFRFFLGAVLNKVASREVARATALWRREPEDEQAAALRGIMPALMAFGDEERAEWAASLGSRTMEQEANNLIGETLARTDPEAGANWILQRGGGPKSMGSVFASWAKLDASKAISFADQLPEGPISVDAATSIIASLPEAEQSSEGFATFVRRHEAGLTPYNLAQLAAIRNYPDPSLILERISTVADPGRQFEIGRDALRNWVRNDPEGARRHVEAHWQEIPPDLRDDFWQFDREMEELRGRNPK